MRKLLLLVAMFAMAMAADAQKLVLDQSLNPGWGGANITNKNKPEGRFYRLRNEVQVTGFFCEDFAGTAEKQRYTLSYCSGYKCNYIKHITYPPSFFLLFCTR